MIKKVSRCGCHGGLVLAGAGWLSPLRPAGSPPAPACVRHVRADPIMCR